MLRYAILALALLLSPVFSSAAQDEPVMDSRLLCSFERGWANDGDAFGNLLFQFHAQNRKPSGDHHGVTVIDLKSGKPLQFINLGFDKNYHNSSITFARKNRKYSCKDSFPLLYASENYAPNEFYKILVYRVEGRRGVFSLEQVQTIDMPDPSALGILYPHAFLDEDGSHIWIEAYSEDQSETVFLKYLLPEFEPDTEVPLGDMIESFRIPRKQVTDQAVCMRGGKFYQVVGVSREAWLRVIDAGSGKVERDYDLIKNGLPYEPEAVFFWKKQLCVSFNDSGKTYVYAVNLK